MMLLLIILWQTWILDNRNPSTTFSKIFGNFFALAKLPFATSETQLYYYQQKANVQSGSVHFALRIFVNLEISTKNPTMPLKWSIQPATENKSFDSCARKSRTSALKHLSVMLSLYVKLFKALEHPWKQMYLGKGYKIIRKFFWDTVSLI